MSEPQSDDDGEEEQPQPIYPNQGPDREGMVNSYIPEDDDWQAKTDVDLNDPAAIAALRNIEEMYPEVDDLQPLIDNFLHEFLKTKTSVKGKSRQEYTGIFKAMFGQGDSEEGSSKLQLVAADDD